MKNIAILVSGSGSNLQRIIDGIDSGEIPNAQINKVIADRECYALERAKKHHISHIVVPRGKNFSKDLEKELPGNTDLIVCAGFLSILSKDFCENWRGKIINVHPSLLPKYGGKGMWGMNVHRTVIEKGEKESGASVHFVTSGIDEGEVIIQKSFPITSQDTPETLAEKVHEVEYEIFPKAIVKVLQLPL